ncbi:MAG: ABC transporter permease [Mycoplasmataceae bacterium]|jgi:hypothetical protein|nr:ABC transporter permease [Mycoplasmataceae bacterium]
MRASLLFINKSFWKSPFNVLFSFGIPALFICASCLAWNLFDGTLSSVLIFPSVSYISIVFISLVVIPTIIFEYRTSNILRRIEDSGAKKISFIWAMGIFFTLLFIASYFFNCAIGTLCMFNNVQVNIMWNTANYGAVVYSLIVAIILCATIGITLGINAKSLVFVQVFGISFILISVFLSYWVAPAQMLNAEPSYNAIRTVSYVWPLKYISNLFTQSWLQTYSFNAFHSSPFDFGSPYASSLWVVYPDDSAKTFFEILSVSDKVADMFVPIAWVVVLGGLNYVFYKYQRRT